MGLTHFPHGISAPIVVPGGGGLISTGIGIGDVKWVVPAKTTSDLWYGRINQIAKDSDIFTTLQAAHDACTSGQGDTIFVAPGLYTTTTQTTFSKSNIQVVGMCGPNNQMAAAATIASRSNPSCTIYCDTAAVVYTLQVTGARNQFYNMSFVNSGAAATNLAALCVGRLTTSTAYGNYFNRCTFHGCMDTAQNTVSNCSVEIGSGASGYMFENCIVGQNTWGGNRATAYQGHIYYSGRYESGADAGVGSQNGIWRDCLILSRTATAAIVPAVRIGSGSIAHGSGSGYEEMDRNHYWINCHFDSWGMAASAMATVFYDLCATGHCNILINSSCHHYTEWRVVYSAQPPSDYIISAQMAVSNATGAGLGIVPTA